MYITQNFSETVRSSLMKLLKQNLALKLNVLLNCLCYQEMLASENFVNKLKNIVIYKMGEFG